MFIRSIRFFAVAVFILSLIPAVTAMAQGQYPPYGPPPGHDDYERDRHREEKERRHEERERQRWREDQWRHEQERYFGGMVVQPWPGESREAYMARMRDQCNIQWSRCAAYCNSIRDPYHRAACVANCNNELYECQRRF